MVTKQGSEVSERVPQTIKVFVGWLFFGMF